jgi:hypothetical protein
MRLGLTRAGRMAARPARILVLLPLALTSSRAWSATAGA